MATIKPLSDDVINKIAAGEVIERPSSVVKELVENSVDAGAGEITVELEEAGKKLIRVIDNGVGMDEEDLKLSVTRHATSKLKSSDDLWRLKTLGFRGEALSSIAAVSRFSISTREKSSPHGLELIPGEGVRPTARSVGTTVSIKNIFEDIPARRKFLKADQTELSYVGEILDRLALASPAVRFRLKHNDKIIKDYLASAHPLDRVKAVMSSELKEIDDSELIPIEVNRGDLILQGILWPSKITKSTSNRILTLINNRAVRDKLLSHAILHGYRSLIEPGRWPIVVLYLDIDPSLVDVNVHPAKAEVRFLQPGLVHDLVSESVREALAGYRGLSEEAPQKSFVRESAVSYGAGRNNVPMSQYVAQAITPANSAPLFETMSEKPGIYSSLKIVGQAANSYIVCERDDALIIIDQHAAHERVNFEELRKEYEAGSVSSQLLLVSEWLELTESEATTLISHAEDLSKFGLEIEAFGSNSISIKAIPSVLGDQPPKALVEALLSDLMSVSRTGGLESEVNHVLATIACHSAVRFNKSLSMDEMRSLLKQLDGVELVSNCPHGRPILSEIPFKELAQKVHRG